MGHLDLDALFTVIRAEPAHSAILLDVDGTLAPIIEDPRKVDIPANIRALLPTVRERFGLTAFVSGRSLIELRAIVGLAGVAYCGNHGVEVQLADGQLLPPQVDTAALAALRGFAHDWAAASHDVDGIWMEDKGASLTFHYRAAENRLVAKDLLDHTVGADAATRGLVALGGRRSLEIHASDTVNKGTAVETLLATRPALRHAVALGDDRTDVDVWHTLRRRMADGALTSVIAVGINAAESPQVLRDEADVLVDGVPGALRVLQALTAHEGADRS
jgi:trehalose 6-phosphate phosphatase